MLLRVVSVFFLGFLALLTLPVRPVPSFCPLNLQQIIQDSAHVTDFYLCVGAKSLEFTSIL